MADMRKIILLPLLLFIFLFHITPVAHAAKTGSACKKLNSKSWDGETPLVCKKVSGKLVWTKFGSTTTSASSNNLVITLYEIGETLPSTDPKAGWYCDNGGYRYKDVSATTGVEVRDGNSGLLATGVLGSSTVLDVEGSALGNCVYKFSTNLKKSDFYQIKIGTRYNKSYSYADLASQNWALTLYIGQP